MATSEAIEAAVNALNRASEAGYFDDIMVVYTPSGMASKIEYAIVRGRMRDLVGGLERFVTWRIEAHTEMAQVSRFILPLVRERRVFIQARGQ